MGTTGRLGIALGACALACACVSDKEIARRSLIAPGSAVAQAIQSARAMPGPYPKFSDIPTVPTDMRSNDAWREAQAGLAADRTLLERQAQAMPADLADTDAFIREVQARTAIEAPIEDSTAAAEAFRRQSIERATPPPPPR